MRVFVTGATGGIGSVTVPELLSAGHEVVGLARSAQSAQALDAMGASALHGDLDDLEALRRGASEADGVIHLAFGADFNNFERSVARETAAVQTFASALASSGKPFVIASGTPAVPGRLSTEEDLLPTEGPIGGRGRNAKAVLDLADKGVRSSVVRLPRSVHDKGGPYGFASILVATAQRSGVSAYVGDGAQRWPAIHRRDAASLFRLALEQAEPGTVIHAVGDEGDTMLGLAEAIAEQLSIAVEAVPAENFGMLGTIFGIDQPSSSAITQRRFGWQPTYPSLLDDLRAGDYPAMGGMPALVTQLDRETVAG